MERSQSHIPNDLFFSLLSKLPIKSLKRFGCVHKSWSLLFDNTHFMTMYRNNLLTKDHPYYHDVSFLLHQAFIPFDGYFHDETFDLYSISGERFQNVIKLDWPSVNLDPEYDSGFNILGSGSVHGILCLFCAYQENILLWNPSTEEFKLIPPSPFDSQPNCYVCVDHHAFGYDFVNNDYRVMRHGIVVDRTNYEANNGPYIWDIYSLRNNSWRKLDVDMENNPVTKDQLYIDGLSHWMCNGETNKTHLLSFDWSNEVFHTTPIPSDMDGSFDCSSLWKHLVLLNGSIAFILNYKETGTFHISILGELGVKKSWTKIFILGPLPCLEYLFGAGKKGNMLFSKKDDDGGLVWFDLNTEMIEELDLNTKKDDDRFMGISSYFKILIHKENILSFEGANI